MCGDAFEPCPGTARRCGCGEPPSYGVETGCLGDLGAMTNTPEVEAERFREMVRLRTAFAESQGASVGRRLFVLQRSMAVFEGNAGDLLAILDPLARDDEHTLVSQLLSQRGELHRFLLSLDRPLHNFLASIRSLVEHTRRATQYLLPAGSAERVEYDKSVTALFEKSPEVQFLEGLRNFVLHYELPPTGANFVMAPANQRSQSVHLDAAALLGSGHEWKPLARTYLKAGADTIDIRELVRRYAAAVHSFHEWLRQAVESANRAVLDAIRPDLLRYRELKGPHDPIVDVVLGS